MTQGDQARQIRKAVRDSDRQRYYADWDAVPHNVLWTDGERIYIVNGANYDEYVFRRTNNNDIDGGEWLSTGVTTGAAASW